VFCSGRGTTTWYWPWGWHPGARQSGWVERSRGLRASAQSEPACAPAVDVRTRYAGRALGVHGRVRRPTLFTPDRLTSYPYTAQTLKSTHANPRRTLQYLPKRFRER
jgi:hypothetical protein